MSAQTTSSTPPTVIAIKQAFLSNQTRLLSQPLNPTRAWRTANDTSDDALPDRLLEDALFRLNQTLQQHARRVYAPQATRHVAEQIDQLYLASPPPGPGDGDQQEGLGVEADLTEDSTIASLPPTWPSERDVTSFPMEARRYAELAAQLTSLREQRGQARERIDRLRRMKTMMDPFRSDDSGSGVQENLVTRDGELEKEMERMRMLLARVGGRVALLPEATDSGSLFYEEDSMIVENVVVGEKRKLDELLDKL